MQLRIPFSAADDKTFKDALETMRPGVKEKLRLDRKSLAGPLLDSACENVEEEMKAKLKSKMCIISQDGWSNISNAPIIATTLLHEGESYPYDFVTTGSEKKTAEFCFGLLKKSIETAEATYKLQIVGFVCDNENKMKRVRQVSRFPLP